MLLEQFLIKCHVPLHAKIASEITQASIGLDAKAVLKTGTGEARTESILSLILLNVNIGDILTIEAEGTDAYKLAERITRILS